MATGTRSLSANLAWLSRVLARIALTPAFAGPGWPGRDAAPGGVALHKGDGVLETRDDALEIFRLHRRNSFFNRVVRALNGVAV